MSITQREETLKLPAFRLGTGATGEEGLKPYFFCLSLCYVSSRGGGHWSMYVVCCLEPEEVETKVQIFHLKNVSGYEAIVTTYGAMLLAFRAPTKDDAQKVRLSFSMWF